MQSRQAHRFTAHLFGAPPPRPPIPTHLLATCRAGREGLLAAASSSECSVSCAVTTSHADYPLRLCCACADGLQVEDSDDEPEGPEENEQDYLAPFLPPITGTRDMTAQEAAAVFQKCVQVGGGGCLHCVLCF